VRTDNFEFIHYATPDGEREGGEGSVKGWGVTHILGIFTKRFGAHSMVIDLSEMTTQELDATKELLDVMFAEAHEVCEHRDQLAREAYEDGNDTHYRLYRTVPAMVDRSGSLGKHSEGSGG